MGFCSHPTVDQPTVDNPQKEPPRPRQERSEQAWDTAIRRAKRKCRGRASGAGDQNGRGSGWWAKRWYRHDAANHHASYSGAKRVEGARVRRARRVMALRRQEGCVGAVSRCHTGRAAVEGPDLAELAVDGAEDADAHTGGRQGGLHGAEDAEALEEAAVNVASRAPWCLYRAANRPWRPRHRAAGSGVA